MSPSPFYVEMLPVPILLRVCVGNYSSEYMSSLATSCSEDNSVSPNSVFYHLSASFPSCPLSISRRMPVYKMDIP